MFGRGYILPNLSFNIGQTCRKARTQSDGSTGRDVHDCHAANEWLLPNYCETVINRLIFMSAEEIPYDIKKPIIRSNRRVSDLYPQLLMKTSLSVPIKIGFSGSLTGSKSEIGVNGRNGALLAVEEINRQGGVTGRKGELVVAKERFQGLQQEIKMDRCVDAVGGYYLYRVQDGVFVKVGPI